MIPILFPHDATTFTGRGIGLLSDAISCMVTEERNGAFDLEMSYPVDGAHYDDIYDKCIIMAIPSPYRDAQPFRVYHKEEPLNGIVTIKAHHISYDLTGIPVEMFTTNTNVQGALNGLVTHSAVTCNFNVSTDLTSSGEFVLEKPASFRSCLGGMEGSILDRFGGEYLFDGFNVNLLSARGSVKDYQVEYAKNIIDFQRTNDTESAVTGIYPFWQKDGETVILTRKIVEIYEDADLPNVIAVDLTDKFENKPTKADLLAMAEKYIADNGLGLAKTSLQVSFVDLASTTEYASRAQDLQIDLCDSVTVVFPMYGVETSAKIVKVVTNVLLDRYEEITLGSQQMTIADTIAGLETSSGGTSSGAVVYPVGSVVVTKTNTDPSAYYSGTWTLVDKEFKSQTRTATVSRNTTNFSALSVTAIYEGHNITFLGTMTSSVSIGETNVEVMTQTLSNNGASSLPDQFPFSGYSDGANAVLLMDIDTAGRVRTLDVVVRGTATSISSGASINWTAICPCVYTAMIDSFCDKFYWERTS